MLLPFTASLSLLEDGFIKLFHDTFGLAPPSQFCSNLEMLSLSSDDRLGAAAGGGFFVTLTSVFESDFESIFFDKNDAVDDDGDKGDSLGSGFEGFEVPLLNGRPFVSGLLGLDVGRC